MKINGVKKVVPNLHNKRNCVIHIQLLNQALAHGLILDQIHRAIKFNQSAWMKTYIDLNTQLRTKAANDFEKDFFKLMNNVVFGKMMENIRKHRNIKLVTNDEKYLKTLMKPNFKSGVLFGENLMGCEMGKVKVVMNKPVYLGQAILDLSKIRMYEFHYDYMKQKYNDDRIQLCYMDTDSLVYSIKTKDFYADITDDIPTRFATSGYIPDRHLPIGLNKKVIGLMKDELGGTIMTEFVALRPKLYSYRVLDGVENKTCKGIKKCIVKKTLMFKDYKNCLFNSDTTYRSQLMFRSIKHEVHMIEVNKVAFNRDDDKLISTLACRHKSLSQENYRLLDTNYKMVGSKSGKVGIEIPRATKSVTYHTCECGYVIRTCSVRERDIKIRLHSKIVISLPKLSEKMRFVLGFLDPQPIQKGTTVKSITELSNICPTGINITHSLFSRHPKNRDSIQKIPIFSTFFLRFLFYINFILFSF